MDICLTDFPQKLETELTKNDSNPHNNDYSPALSQNKYVETFHEKYLIDKIRLEKENPLNDDYLKKKKSINNYVCNGSKEDDNRLRSSYGYKSFDDFDVGYEKDNFVPLFNFNSNKSQFTSHNSKKDGMIKANTSVLLIFLIYFLLFSKKKTTF